ncbi:MAG: DUF3999 family protein [Elusimicrobia bacterium]|nr:DUF3999 family protein [Elusimicrobiota bacterium]
MKYLALAVGLLIPAQASADFNARDWRYSRPILAPIASSASYVSLILDAAAFGAAQPSLADLRILSADGVEVPYHLVVSRNRSETQSVQAEMVDLATAKGSVSFILNLKPFLSPQMRRGPVERHNVLTIRTPTKNFRAIATVEGSDDRRSWYTLWDNAVVFNVSADYTASHLSVSYPMSTRRFLRVTLRPQNSAVPSIQGADVTFETAQEAGESVWTPKSLARHEEGKTSVWDVDLGYQNVPVSRVGIATRDVNFSRPGRVFVSSPSAQGRETGPVAMSGVFWRYALPRVSNEGLSIAGGEVRARRFRLEIDNGDNPPLNVQDILFFGPRRTLYFPPNRRWPYRLYSGNPDASSPVYDLAAFSGYLDLLRVPRLNFGDVDAEVNARYQATDRRPWTEKHEHVFWASLLSLCAFLIWMIVQKTREILRG